MTAPSGQGLNSKQLAQSLFDYIVQAYSVATDTEPLPARQVVSGGDIRLVAWDCDQMTVSLAGIDIDVPANLPTTPGILKAASLRHVALTVQIVRCTAQMDTKGRVDPAEITKRGLQAMRDAGLLSQILFEWTTRAVSTAGPMGVLAAAVGAVIPVGPLGGLAGVEGQAVVSAELTL